MWCDRGKMTWPICCGLLLLGICALACPAAIRADEFTIITETGKEVTFEAELAGSDDKWHALALADGQYKLVPQAAVASVSPRRVRHH